MTLESTRPLTGMSTRDISWGGGGGGKGGRIVGFEKLLEPSETVQRLLYLCLMVMQHKIHVYSGKLIRFYVSCFQLEYTSQLLTILR
jgi:hypothetical protein